MKKDRTSKRPGQVRFEIAIRAFADLLMVNFAMVLGLLVSAALGEGRDPSRVSAISRFQSHFENYLSWGWLTSAIAIGVFYGAGFYTKGRAYQSRYKALVVLQASALVFLIFGCLSFLMPRWIDIPRSALVSSALIGVGTIVASRVWSTLWEKLIRDVPAPAHAPSSDDLERVLVIGGAGYVGSSLLEKLLSRGYQVRLLDMFMYGEEPIADLIGHERLEIIRADFRQIDKVVEAVRNVDAVIHIGAIVGDPACALDEQFTIEVNLSATRMIAEVAKAYGIRRFIFASTCSVYGASNEILDERSALNPVSLYARSKIASERVLKQMTDSNFRPTILRFGTVYGLSGRTRFDLVVNLLTAKAVVDGKITVFGADQWRPFVHVSDTAQAVLRVLEAPLDVVGGETYNVGSDEQNCTLGEIGEMIKRHVPRAELITSGTDGDRRNYRVDFSKLRAAVGFKPEWTLDKGIDQVIQAFRTGFVTDYHDSRYSNVKFLTEEAGRSLVSTESEWLRKLIDETPHPDGGNVPKGPAISTR